MAMRAVKRRPGRPGVLAVQLDKRALDRERRPHCALGIVLLRHRIAEQRHQSVAELLGDLTAHFHDRRRSGVEIRAHEIAPLLSIEARGNAGRIHQIAEHHCHMPALASSFRGGHRGCRRSQSRRGCQCGWWSFRTCVSAQGRNSVKQHAAMPESVDA
jgi:hypothetical protein